MQILDNNKEWVENALAKDPNFFSELAKGQTPPLLWIGCSDSRVPANEKHRKPEKFCPQKYCYGSTLT
jgi:carbonic anhydrase